MNMYQPSFFNDIEPQKPRYEILSTGAIKGCNIIYAPGLPCHADVWIGILEGRQNNG